MCQKAKVDTATILHTSCYGQEQSQVVHYFETTINAVGVYVLLWTIGFPCEQDARNIPALHIAQIVQLMIAQHWFK